MVLYKNEMFVVWQLEIGSGIKKLGEESKLICQGKQRGVPWDGLHMSNEWTMKKLWRECMNLGWKESDMGRPNRVWMDGVRKALIIEGWP